MKLTTTLLLFIFAINLSASDTIHIKETQIPILIDRKDNALYYLRIDAKESKTLQQIILKFGKKPI